MYIYILYTFAFWNQEYRKLILQTFKVFFSSLSKVYHDFRYVLCTIYSYIYTDDDYMVFLYNFSVDFATKVFIVNIKRKCIKTNIRTLAKNFTL